MGNKSHWLVILTKPQHFGNFSPETIQVIAPWVGFTARRQGNIEMAHNIVGADVIFISQVSAQSSVGLMLGFGGRLMPAALLHQQHLAKIIACERVTYAFDIC